jgi:hypothetical protein
MKGSSSANLCANDKMKQLLIITIVSALLTGCGSEPDFSGLGFNKHGVIYHACCEADPCCGMQDCCYLKEKKSGEACKNSNCVKISREDREKAARLKAIGK